MAWLTITLEMTKLSEFYNQTNNTSQAIAMLKT